MNYTPLTRDDFDKSFKYEKQSYLCYSEKKLKELFPDKDYEIIGLARKSDKDTDNKLVLGKNFMSVYDIDKDSALYKNIGFIPVNDDRQYIAVQENTIPFFIGIGSMIAATAMICCIIINTNPVNPINPVENKSAPMFNPLPPVDTNIEDYVDDNKKSSEKSDVPKGGGKVAISYKPSADIYLKTGEVKMEYQNPDVSSHDAVISLYVVSDNEEYLIANSGRIPAGKQLKTMQLTADKELFSSEGKYNAEYKVTYYNPKTGERALTEATIDDITLTVRNK